MIMAADIVDSVRLKELFCEERIVFAMQAKGKDEIVSTLAGTLVETGQLKKNAVEKFVEGIKAREKLGTTAIGKGVAIPHVRTESCSGLVGVLGVSTDGVDFDSLDKKPTHAIFMLASPMADKDQQIRILGRIAAAANQENFLSFLLHCKSAKDVVDLLDEIEDQIPGN